MKVLKIRRCKTCLFRALPKRKEEKFDPSLIICSHPSLEKEKIFGRTAENFPVWCPLPDLNQFLISETRKLTFRGEKIFDS